MHLKYNYEYLKNTNALLLHLAKRTFSFSPFGLESSGNTV